jgi:hypothetical protein
VNPVGPSLPPNLDIQYAAPPECPDRGAFEASIRRRIGHAAKPPEGSADPKRFDVRLELTARGVRGRLAVPDGTGGTTVREIEAATCAEAVDGLALIVALLFDPESAKSPTEAAPPEVPVKRAPPPATNEPKRSRHVALATSFIVASGHAPKALPGGELAVALETPLFAQLLLIVRAGVRLTVPDTVASNEGLATFKWWAGVVTLCPALAFGDQSFAQALCVTVEQGVLSATGSETRNPRSSGRSWTALGPGVAFRWAMLPPLYALVAAEALFPLNRDRFVLGSEQIHEVPPVAFRGEVGLGVRF